MKPMTGTPGVDDVRKPLVHGSGSPIDNGIRNWERARRRRLYPPLAKDHRKRMALARPTSAGVMIEAVGRPQDDSRAEHDRHVGDVEDTGAQRPYPDVHEVDDASIKDSIEQV